MTVRAAVIGLGVGEQHAAAYAAHPDAEVVALCDIDEERLAEVGRRYPRARRTADAHELLGASDIDAVSIASFDDVHHEQIMAALSSGKHVFVEKPLCLTADETADIRGALAARPDLVLSSNLILRMSPRFVWLKERIEAGELGRLYHVEGDYEYGRLAKLTDGWRGRLPHYSVVLGGGVHMVDLLLWLTGDRVVEVAAYGNRISTEGSRFRFDDMVVAVLSFESGMVGKVSANFGCVHPHFHGLTVYGTKATFINRPGDAEYWTRREDEGQATVDSAPVKAAYPGVGKGDLIASFICAVNGQGEPVVSADEVFDVMYVCLAIERAAREGRAVAVEYP